MIYTCFATPVKKLNMWASAAMWYLFSKSKNNWSVSLINKYVRNLEKTIPI